MVVQEASPMDAGSVECRELLERVVNSRELKRASRLRELLLFIGKQAQDSPLHIIREQEIGAAVFGRPLEYDTSLDNIVRVNVSELRKRLAHFFQDEGINETIVIEIPRGGYLPIFLPRPHIAEEKPIEHVSGPPISKPLAVSASSEKPFDRPRSPRVYLIPLIGTLALAIAACGLLLWQNSRLAAQLQPWKADALHDSFLPDFFASGEQVDIVTADTSFALTEDILGQSISLDDYLDYKYKDFADQPSLPPATKSALKHILERNNGSIGDFQVAKRFMDLDGHASTVRLASARSYTAENIKTNNVILIGGRESNPWVDLYKDRMNFFMEYEPNGQRSYIANHNPKPGEKPVYETLQDKTRSYSVVTFLPNIDTHNFALIISGTDSQATRAAGEFVTSADGLAQIRQKMPTGRFPYFELVLSSARLSGTTLRTEIEAYRVHQR
jgi:hypothetical protein